MANTRDLNRKLISEEFTIFKPALIAHADVEMDLKSLKLFHEVLGFNHRSEPDRYEYNVDYELICKSQDIRNIQKTITQEVTRIGSRMQGFVLQVDKNKMYEVTGERNIASVSPFDRIVYQGSQVKIVLGRTFKKLLVRYQQFYLGDARTVRGLNHKASIHMYWLIISHSWKGCSFEVTVQELKELLGCPTAYENRWDNFRKYILEPIRKEFKNTWAKFEYTTKRKGRKIHSLRFDFESDAQVIRNIINESPFKFEHQLHLYQMKKNAIIHIRDQVLKNVYTEQDVEKVIKHAQDDRRIKSKSGFIIKALKEGWYQRMAVQSQLAIPEETNHQKTPIPVNGYWGVVQHYWEFTDKQMHALRQVYNEASLKRAHYNKSIFFNEQTNRDLVFDSFIEGAAAQKRTTKKVITDN